MRLSSSFRVTLSALLVSTVCFALPLSAAQNFNHDSVEEGDAPPPPVATPQTAPAVGLQATDLQLRMNALENLVRGMTGQMEKLTFQVNQLAQTQQKIAADNDIRFKDLEQKIATHEANMKGLVAAQQNLAAQQQAAAAAPPPTPTPTPTPAVAPEPAETGKTLDAPQPKDKSNGTLGTISKNKDEPNVVKGDDSTAQAQYDEAFNALRQAKYDDAEKAFTVFLKNHPKHHLTENAKYWLAETFYVRGKFQEAAVSFAEAYQEFPKGAKAPDNLLKLSMSLGSMGKKADACTTLGELSKKFPSATAVTKNRAEQQKKTLGCS